VFRTTTELLAATGRVSNLQLTYNGALVAFKHERTEEPVSTPQGSVVSRCLCRPRDGGSGKAEMDENTY